MNEKRHIRKRFRATGVIHNIPLDPNADEDPLAVHNVIGQVDLLGPVCDVHLKSIIGPRTELHLADLVIEREVGYVHFAGALKLCRYGPKDVTSVFYHCIG